MTVKENYLRALSFADPDHVPFEGIMQVVRYQGDMMWFGESGLDPWGVGWESIQSEFMPMAKSHPFTDWDKAESFPIPDPADFRLHPEGKRLLDSANREEVLLFSMQPHVVLERGCMLAGMEEMFAGLANEPEAAGVLLSRIADYHVGIAKRYLEEVPELDGGYLGDDYGTQRALMISPTLWRRFVKPQLRRIVEVYRAAGKWVLLHSCGHITEIVEDLIEIGVQIVNPTQARANNLEEWGCRFGGRIVFNGGVDTQYTLTRGTPEEVRREVRLRLRQLAGDRGGFIIGQDQMVPIPEENLAALYDEAARSGRYPVCCEAVS